MKPETKYKASLKLAAIADALGWMTEFDRPREALFNEHGIGQIDRYYSWSKNVGGRFVGYIDQIKAGSYSDDTQLMLAVARSIKKDGNVDNEYFAKYELSNWLFYARGAGKTVKIAADKISRKSANWNSNFYSYKSNNSIIDYRDSGANGAAMRILPIALANIGDVEKIKTEIFCNSIATHGHPRAIIGAMVYGYCINQIIIFRPEDFHWDAFLAQIGSQMTKDLALTFIDKPNLQTWLRSWNLPNRQNFETVFRETLVEAQNLVRIVYQSIKNEWSDKDTLDKLGCYNPSTKGSGISTVAAGVYFASKYSMDPTQGILNAVNAFGTDTDSIAAFTGGLLGALHGTSIIPDKWKEVQDHDYLDKVALDLLAVSEGRYENVLPQGNPKLRSLTAVKDDDLRPGDLVTFPTLGNGNIKSIDRQPTLTRGKFNLLLEVDFEIGQSCVFSFLLDDQSNSDEEKRGHKTDELLILAKERLKPKTYEKFEAYLTKHMKMVRELRAIIEVLIKNDE